MFWAIPLAVRFSAKKPPSRHAERLSIPFPLDEKTLSLDQVEISTQYFRRKWRPFLDPLLSELIRELRQRCYEQSVGLPQICDIVEASYSDLADNLGVNRSTIHRALTRESNGSFKNPHLHLFLLDIKQTQRRNSKGGVKTRVHRLQQRRKNRRQRLIKIFVYFCDTKSTQMYTFGALLRYY